MKKIITVLISCLITSCVIPTKSNDIKKENNISNTSQNQSSITKNDINTNIVDKLPTDVYIEEGSNIQINDLSTLNFEIINKDISSSDKDGFLYAKSKGDTQIDIKDSSKKINIHVVEEQKNTNSNSYNCDDLCDMVVISGNIYDLDKNLINGAKVKAYSLYPSVKWFGEEQITKNGNYSFRRVPTGISINIIVTKDGYKTIKRGLITRSNLDGDATKNKINFGGNELKNDVNFAITKL
ncbi:MAG: carboxypeptidase-like regulatory domain-containing protein [Candidatus Sericytochromatia bacterium]